MDENVTARLSTDSEGSVPLETTSDHYAGRKHGIEESCQYIMDTLSAIQIEIETFPRQRLQGLSPRLQRFEPEQLGIGNQDHVDELLNQLLTKNQELEAEKVDLEARLTAAELNLQQQAAKETDLKNEISALHYKAAHLKSDNVGLRSIILKNAADQEITDQDVIDAFSDVRRSVQKLARNPIFDLTTPPQRLDNIKKPGMREFYTVIQGLPPKDIGLRLQSLIFDVLDVYVFLSTCFGLKRDNKVESNEFHWEIENALVRFEEILLEEQNVDKTKVLDWRISTLDCISMLKLPDIYKYYVAEKIDLVISPLKSRRSTRLQQEELRKITMEVCNKAIKLKKMMQRSRAGYMVDQLNIGPLYSEIEASVDCVGVENGKAADGTDEIAYVLFGSLQKNSRKGGGKRKTLVKAEVVLKRKPKE